LLNIKDDKNNKSTNLLLLLCSIFAFILLTSLIQMNVILASIPQINNNTILNNVTNADNSGNNRVNVGPDLTVFEGDLITLKTLIANAISLPSQSVIYSWNQVDGPKINLAEEEKQNKNLQFIAPNRPNDSKYVFELKAIQKTESKNIDLGKDSVTITVLDINKVAKGITMPDIPWNLQNNSNLSN
jgi:hypothetical protein